MSLARLLAAMRRQIRLNSICFTSSFASSLAIGALYVFLFMIGAI